VSTETMPEVLHAIGLGVEHLRARIAELECDLITARDGLDYEKSGREDTERKLSDTRELLSQHDREIVKLRTEINRHEEARPRGEANLARIDQLTLDLYHYIVELAGHRDTAKTKAERIALGHVVERLAEIRGMSDVERKAIA